MPLPGSTELALSFLIGCTVKATLVLTLAAVAARAMRRGSASTRQHAWALGIACSLALPIFTILLPSWHSATLGSAARFWTAAHMAGGSVHIQRLPSTVIDAAAASPLSGTRTLCTPTLTSRRPDLALATVAPRARRPASHWMATPVWSPCTSG